VPVFGLTGGIATGKSTFSKSLLSRIPEMQHFDSDRHVHSLLSSSKTVREQIVEKFGEHVLGDDNFPSREKLRDLVFVDSTKRKILESILHPAVRREWEAQAVSARKSATWLLVDIPLLYETNAQESLDTVIVVACPKSVQLNRLIFERGLALELSKRIIDTQMEIGVKIEKADHVIWNDSTVHNLDGQSGLLAAWLRRKFG
jgi:dephospho-CoA kinase